MVYAPGTAGRVRMHARVACVSHRFGGVRAPVSITEHALIGNGRSCALVARDGTIDWLCWPRPDSASLFAALLDPACGGGWQIAPVRRCSSTWRYAGDSNVMATTFDTASGRATLVDAMPIEDSVAPVVTTRPEHAILRLVTCDSGEVELVSRFAPRPDYARAAVRLRDRGVHGIALAAAQGTTILRGERAHRICGDDAIARFTLRAGDSALFALVYAGSAPAVLPALGDAGRAAIDRTIALWEAWAARARYDGPFRSAVVRSALVLKLLAYAPSGAILAAPTTSLPERIGGSLNWDYRFSWLRDAALTAGALAGLGYGDERDAWVSWLLHSTPLTRPGLAPLYTVFGERPPRERTLDHLAGFAGSRPVRIGNAARSQFQLDVYGQVVTATAELAGNGRALDARTQAMMQRFAGIVARSWRVADAGIWELRSPPRHRVGSLALGWAALDRAIALADGGQLPRFARARATAERDAIRAVVEARGFSAALGSYTETLDVDDVDASLLLLPRFGYCAADDPRMRGTLAHVRARLGAGGPLLYRFAPERVGGEGAFACATFWEIDAFARAGRVDDAVTRFEAMLRYATSVGLWGEEVEPSSGAALGNFPQGYSHVGVIDAALAIARAVAAGTTRRAVG